MIQANPSTPLTPPASPTVRAYLRFAGLPAEAGGDDLARTIARIDPPAILQASFGPLPPPAPALQPSSMTPQPLDLGPVSEVADGTWRTFDKWPFLRGITIWVLFLSLLCAVFYVVRF
jgi:hypothetical protein